MISQETVLYKLFMKCRKYLPRNIKLLLGNVHFSIYGRRMPWSLIRFDVHVTDNCNLHCAGCLHFSSLCNGEEYLDIKAYEKDCERISRLTNGKIADIRLLGGEPLLHPDINSFLTITRSYFPELNISEQTGVIELVTNGILLHKQPDDFWKICNKNNIRIVISEYPVNIKAETIKEKAKQFNVELKMNSEKIKFKEGGSANHWVKIPIDINGLQNYKKNFGRCSFAGTCFQLVKGKIYKCARIPYVNYFNTAFCTQLKIDESDYVDIYKANDIKDILYSLTEPAFFCRYCKVNDTSWDIKWEVSKGRIEEWV